MKSCLLILITLWIALPFDSARAQTSTGAVLLQGLDRTTARTSTFEVKRNKSVFWGRLEIYMRFCKKSDPTEVPDNTAFLEIYEYPLTRRAAIAQSLRQAELKDSAAKLSRAKLVQRKLLREKLVVEEYGDEILQEEFAPDLLFSGWMVSSSPPLNPLEHPVFDIWVTDCK